jgi:transposase
MGETRRAYSKEFKEEALALLRTSGKTMHALEQELGLSHGLLKQWKRRAEKDGEQAFPGHGNLKADEAELRLFSATQLSRCLAATALHVTSFEKGRTQPCPELLKQPGFRPPNANWCNLPASSSVPSTTISTRSATKAKSTKKVSFGFHSPTKKRAYAPSS